jgi:hypothetical protein
LVYVDGIIAQKTLHVKTYLQKLQKLSLFCMDYLGVCWGVLWAVRV